MQLFLKNKYVLDFFATLMFFTRIPVKWSYFSKKAPDLTRASWSFPSVGFLVGILSGGVGDILIKVGLPVFLSCVIAIIISVILTGAFHEDGLADTADGLGAGGSPRNIDKIIHDSRLGTYGVMSLILGILVKLGLILALFESGYSLIAIFSIGFATGKLSIMIARNLFNNSEFAKTASIVGKISNKCLFIATLTWIIPTSFIFDIYGILFGIILMTFTILLIGKKSKNALGGINGDILGAIAFLTDIMFLFGNIIVILVVN